MKRTAVLLLSTLVAGSGCALLPEEPPAPTDPDDLDTFVESLREAIEEHDWQVLLTASDPRLYQREVVEQETPEPVFVAELFGLRREGNTIQEGDELDWDDFDRVTEVGLASSVANGPPYRVTGFAQVEDGREFDLETWVTQVQGRLVLTGAP